MIIEEQLENLNLIVVKMANQVVYNIKEAIEMYHEGKVEFINDDIVNNYEKLVNEISLSVMVKTNPYARDLRIVTGILKLVSDLERIGDHACDIMNFTSKLVDLKFDRNPNIRALSNLAITMVEDAVKSFVNKDVDLAHEIIKRDDQADKLYDELIEWLVLETNKKNDDAKFVIYTTLVVKYIERICDHAVNIAEWVIYIDNGIYKDRKIF